MAAKVASHAVYMGNLRSDMRIVPLKQNIIHLLYKLNISITKRDINIHMKPKCAFAFIQLSTEHDMDLMLELLNSEHVLSTIDLRDIIEDGHELRVAPKLERVQLLLENSKGVVNQKGALVALQNTPQQGSVDTRVQPFNDTATFVNAAHLSGPSDTRKTYTVVGNKFPISKYHSYTKTDTVSTPLFRSSQNNHTNYGPCLSENDLSDKEMSTQSEEETGSEEEIVSPNQRRHKRRYRRRRKNRFSPGKPIMEGSDIDVDALTKSGTLKENILELDETGKTELFHKNEYVLNEVLGNETRMLEFKRGQGMYLQRQLYDQVAVYASAFLNAEGGTLLIGVNDDGEVQGVDIDRSLEDRLRITVDQTVSEITPTVFPSMYSVQFVPVTDEYGKLLGDLKVVEVGVRPGTSSQLYQTVSGNVYVRRDGSVQGPLKAHVIQEWTRMMMSKEQLKKDHEITNLREHEQELMEELMKRRDNEEKLISMLKQESNESLDSDTKPRKKSKKRKSKVCIIL